MIANAGGDTTIKSVTSASNTTAAPQRSGYFRQPTTGARYDHRFAIVATTTVLVTP